MPEEIFDFDNFEDSVSAEEGERLNSIRDRLREDLSNSEIQEKAKKIFEALLLELGATEDAGYTSEYIVVELMKDEGSYLETERAIAAVISSATGKDDSFFRERLRKELAALGGEKNFGDSFAHAA